MKHNLFRILVSTSLFVNIGAMYIWGQWFLQTYVVHRQIQEFGGEVQRQISATGFHVVYVDKEYCIARKDDGAWFFRFSSSDDVIAFAAKKDSQAATARGQTQYMLSANRFFAGWKRVADTCEDVVVQYNDNPKFTDRLGVGEMKTEGRDALLFWTDQAIRDAKRVDLDQSEKGPLQKSRKRLLSDEEE